MEYKALTNIQHKHMVNFSHSLYNVYRHVSESIQTTDLSQILI